MPSRYVHYHHQEADVPAEPGHESIILRRTGNATPFPHLEKARFEQLQSTAQALDVHRFLWSPTSEDWFTWNAFHLLQMARPEDWWKLFGLAEAPTELRFWNGPAELEIQVAGRVISVETLLRHDASARFKEPLRAEAERWIFLKAGVAPAAVPAGIRVWNWAEVLSTIWSRQPGDDTVLAGVKKELRRRAGEPSQTPVDLLSDEDVTRGVLHSRGRLKG